MLHAGASFLPFLTLLSSVLQVSPPSLFHLFPPFRPSQPLLLCASPSSALSFLFLINNSQLKAGFYCRLQLLNESGYCLNLRLEASYLESWTQFGFCSDRLHFTALGGLRGVWGGSSQTLCPGASLRTAAAHVRNAPRYRLFLFMLRNFRCFIPFIRLRPDSR